MVGNWEREDRCRHEPRASTCRVSSLHGNSLDAALEHIRSIFQVILYNPYSSRLR